ncbi:MAG: ABC transporter ATP-binding protein [Clostridia bacterium]|nr:ABC transporter ATP-binding protein [Clostridia bacterium]
MIEVSHLTKKYGAHTAVDDLSFTIGKGSVHGFLGPNGAGKSTTMNIITGCLGATQGEVTIGGVDIFEEPLKAKKLIGYLPELPPLYTDMTPREYLRFVMEAKGIPKKNQAQQLLMAIEKTGITQVADRLIRTLSKGYRQRVGLAQALLGDPQVIILDEPTVGLDPAQIIEIRELIRELGKEHTVILSSHILSEVSAVCDSIMIISHGKLVASDTPDNLTHLFAGTATVSLTALASQAEMEPLLNGLDGIEKLTWHTGDEMQTAVDIQTQVDADIRRELFFRFANAGKPIIELTRSHASLEDVFLELTQETPDKKEAKDL